MKKNFIKNKLKKINKCLLIMAIFGLFIKKVKLYTIFIDVEMV